MGNIMNFLIALEAEDITKDVDKEMKKAIGKPSVSSAIKEDEDDDIGKTDDLLGTKSSSKNKKDDNTKPPKDAPSKVTDTDTEPTDDLGDIDNVDDMDEDNIDAGDDNTDDLDTDPLASPDENQDQNPDENNDDKSEELNNKIRLRENMILFYNILSSNIKLLSEYVPDNNIEENTNALSTVSNNLVECKTILFNIITEELENKTYVELLRKYIALNRVYDLNIRILDTYFSDLKLISTKK